MLRYGMTTGKFANPYTSLVHRRKQNVYVAIYLYILQQQLKWKSRCVADKSYTVSQPSHGDASSCDRINSFFRNEDWEVSRDSDPVGTTCQLWIRQNRWRFLCLNDQNDTAIVAHRPVDNMLWELDETNDAPSCMVKDHERRQHRQQATSITSMSRNNTELMH